MRNARLQKHLHSLFELSWAAIGRHLGSFWSLLGPKIKAKIRARTPDFFPKPQPGGTEKSDQLLDQKGGLAKDGPKMVQKQGLGNPVPG